MTKDATHAIDSHPVQLSASTVAAMRRLGVGGDELESCPKLPPDCSEVLGIERHSGTFVLDGDEQES